LTLDNLTHPRQREFCDLSPTHLDPTQPYPWMDPTHVQYTITDGDVAFEKGARMFHIGLTARPAFVDMRLSEHLFNS